MQKNYHHISPLFASVLLLCTLALSGCAGAVFGVGTAAVAASTTEKGFSTSVSDGVIFAKLKDRFIQQQFAAQTQHYHTNYCSDFFNIIEVDENNAGRFFVDYWSNEIRIVDIALLPKFQNSGLGTYLMKKILKEGQAQDKPVTIHVEEQNPARRLYERLGFKEKSRFNDVYILMECVA